MSESQTQPVRLQWPALLALACVSLAIITNLVAMGGLARALATPAPRAAAFDQAALESRFEAHARDYDEKLLAQISGRSPFFVPPEPPPPPPPRVEREPSAPAPPPPPSRYGGPALIAIFDNQAWFSDGTRLSPGDAFNDLEVIELAPPWEARVRWKGVEFTIDLFSRDRIVLPEKED